MAKYRKRPVVVDAEQWFPGRHVPGVVANRDNNPMTPNRYSIETWEGHMAVAPGDWIITGVKGEKYPCKPDIFAATYDPVEG